MNDLKFYERLHNEDSEPYVDETMLVVADGLGGSGSAEHHIDVNKLRNINLLKKIVIESSIDDKFDDTLKVIFDSILNGSGIYTSALIASRVVMARYIYEILNNHLAFMDQDFGLKLRKSLENMAKEFNLMNDICNPSLRLLPTTLASIVFNNDKEFNAYAVWAGDSRCYFLGDTVDGKFGLKHLSIDDEDEDGAINNLCYLGKKETVIHFKEYKGMSKGIYFVASDGLFDILSNNASLELIIYKAMFRANNFESFQLNLKQFYCDHKADDCSLAMKMIGFKSFKDMQDYYNARYNALLELEKDYEKYSAGIYVIENPEVVDELYNYMVERLFVKKGKFIELLKIAIKNKDLSNPWLIKNNLINKMFGPRVIKDINDSVIKEIIKYAILDEIKADTSKDISNIFGEKYANCLRDYAKKFKIQNMILKASLEYSDKLNNVMGRYYSGKSEVKKMSHIILKRNKELNITETVDDVIEKGIRAYWKNKKYSKPLLLDSIKDETIKSLLDDTEDKMDQDVFADKTALTNMIKNRLLIFDGKVCEIDSIFNESRFLSLAKYVKVDLNDSEFLEYYNKYNIYCNGIYDLL